MGLELREETGPWMCADTKLVLLGAGIVSLVDYSGVFDEKVEVPAGVLGSEPTTIIGTRDPKALEIARRKSRQELPYKLDGSWTDIELTAHFEIR